MKDCLVKGCKRETNGKTRCKHHLKKSAENVKKYYRALRREIIEHYSNGKMECKSCGVEDFRVLQIDHINNDGQKEKKKINPRMKRGCGSYFLYHWIKKNGFPPRYQVLCLNCNHIKRLEHSGWQPD